jgi:hypothetical protein
LHRSVTLPNSVKRETKKNENATHSDNVPILRNCATKLSSLGPAATPEIQMPEPEFKAGTVIRIDVIVKNLSAKDLRIWKTEPQVDGQAEAYLSIHVRDSEGKPLSRIDGLTIEKNGKDYTIEKRWLTRKGTILIPNHELHDFLLLSSLFDLSKPAIYVVSAEADIPKPYSGPEIKWIVTESNNVTFAIK